MNQLVEGEKISEMRDSNEIEDILTEVENKIIKTTALSNNSFSEIS